MLDNDAMRQLAVDLLWADTEQEVIATLEKVDLWRDSTAWRLYGDLEGNYATIGNQQSRPEAALVEKIVNSVDARLMNECICCGIDPVSADAPQSIRAAVARFFENRELHGDIGGTIDGWTRDRRLEQSQYITVAATGGRQAPSLTVADCGEGQTPSKMPETLLSIHRTNKLKIPFVQGKFNMGATGVLKFGAENRLQFVISRRNPAIMKDAAECREDDHHWGFTIIRRERPTEQAAR